MKIVWDKSSERFFQRGVDHGVLYHKVAGAYVNGEAWNGLTNVTEQPSGAESNKQYADNIEYVNLMSAEQYGASIECFMAPDGFLQYDGVDVSDNGVAVGMQRRDEFGFSWRTLKGNADNEDLGEILHFAYGCKAQPGEKSNNTVNESPELATFSWTLSTTPVEVTGKRPTAYVFIDSTDPKVNPARLAALKDIIYGDALNAPRLPLPDELETIMGTGVLTATPVNPTYDAGTDTITIPNVTGVDYLIDGVVVPAGPVVITEDTIVTAQPDAGYKFTGVFVDRWMFDFS